jgi:hypothetical protein
MNTRFLSGADGTIHAILPAAGQSPRGPGAPTGAKIVPRADQRIHEIDVPDDILRGLRRAEGAKAFCIRNGKLERR